MYHIGDWVVRSSGAGKEDNSGQYFNLAESRLYSELEHALGKSRTDVESMIKKICEKE